MSVEKNDLTEEVKKIIVRSIYSNDDLFNEFVLKGGNAIALIHNKKIRKSIDVDFSISEDFPGGINSLEILLFKSLNQGFNEANYHFFDFKIKETPKNISGDMKDFWGGYSADFKIIDIEQYKKIQTSEDTKDLQEVLRRNALSVHGSTKIEIDISKHENVSNKIERDLDGVTVYAYSVEMIVAEKLRALCQQHIQYGAIVQRNRPGSPRPKDFFDIHLLMTECNIDMLSADNIIMLREMFLIKRVPLELLTSLEDQKDFHGANFAAVTANLDVEMDPKENFDFYFNYVNDLAKSIYRALG